MPDSQECFKLRAVDAAGIGLLRRGRAAQTALFARKASGAIRIFHETKWSQGKKFKAAPHEHIWNSSTESPRGESMYK